MLMLNIVRINCHKKMFYRQSDLNLHSCFSECKSFKQVKIMSVSRSKYRPLSLQTCHSRWSPSYMVSILWSIQLWSISRGIPEITLAKPSSCPSMGAQGQGKTMSPALLLRKCLKKEWKVDLFTSYLLQKSFHILRWWQCTKYSIYFHSCNFNILSVTHVFKTVYPHIIFQLKKWIVIICLICNSV